MTVAVIKGGVLVIDRCVTASRNGVVVSSRPITKMLEFSTEAGITIKGKVITKAFVTGDWTGSSQLCTMINSTNTVKTIEEFLVNHQQYAVVQVASVWLIPDPTKAGFWYRVNWKTGTINTVTPMTSDIIRPTDTQVPELEKWLETPEEIVWLYNRLSKRCGFGLNRYNPWLGVLEQIDEPSLEVSERIRLTLIRSIDLWFLKETEPSTELSSGDKELVG